MNLISDILPSSNVVINLAADSKEPVFAYAAELLAKAHGVDAKAVLKALVQREKLGSTGLGQGVAIPHGRIKGVKQSIGAFIRTEHGIPFDAPDGHPVQLIFVMLVPEQANETHLHLLSELAQMFSDRVFRDALSEAQDAQAAFRLIADWAPHQTLN